MPSRALGERHSRPPRLPRLGRRRHVRGTRRKGREPWSLATAAETVSVAVSKQIREANARQEALVESLTATIEAGETLQDEVAEHAAWQQRDYSFQLTVLGCVLSVLGFCSISIDALALVARLRQSNEDGISFERQSSALSEGLGALHVEK